MQKSISLFLILLVNSTLFGSRVEVQQLSEGNLFHCTAVENNRVEVSFSLDGYDLETITGNGEIFQQISYFNEGEFVEIGKPALPRFTRLITIPNRGEVSFNIIHFVDEIIPDSIAARGISL